MKPVTPIDLPEDFRRRVGRFKINANILEDQRGLLMAVLSSCLIVRVEHLYYSNEIEYIAYCAEFDAVPLCNITPLYRLVIGEEFQEYSGVANEDGV